MNRNIDPRLRAPIRVLAVGVAAVVAAASVHGWGSPIYLVLIPFVVVLAVAYYVWGGRDSDAAAVLRRETDERQDYHRLQAQALVGKVMSLAVAVAYLAAYAAKVQQWPFAVFLGLAVAAQLVGRVLYRDHNDDGLAGH